MKSRVGAHAEHAVRSHSARSTTRGYAIDGSALRPPRRQFAARSPNSISVRPASTSSLFTPLSSFFSRQQPAHASSSSSQQSFRDAIASRKIEDMEASYDHSFKSPTLKSRMTENDILAAMRACVEAKSPLSFALLRRLYIDLPKLGISRKSEHHTLIIQGLCDADRPEEAFELAKRLVQTGNHTEVDWATILEAAVRCDADIIQNIADTITLTRPLYPQEQASLLRDLRYRIRQAGQRIPMEQSKDRLAKILENGESDVDKLNEEGKAEFVLVQILLQMRDEAEALIDRWGWRDADKESLSKNQWRGLAWIAIARKDLQGVEELLRECKSANNPDPPGRAVAYLTNEYLDRRIRSKSQIGTEDIVRVVEEVEDLTGYDASSETWVGVLRRLIRTVPNSMSIALDAYDVARDRGIATDLSLARALIIPLCDTKPLHLKEVMQVYDHYTLIPVKESGRRYRNTLTELYLILLQACAETATVEANAFALRLLSDMRNQNLSFAPESVTSTTVLLMKSAVDHQTAFDMYANIYACNRKLLVETAFSTIISAFLSFSTNTSPYPPPQLYLDMVKDMHRAGYPPTPQIVTSLLDSYGNMAKDLRKSKGDAPYAPQLMEGLIRAIRQVHMMIKLDAWVDIDIALLCALMDAYNKAGLYGEAFEVWEQLVERRARESQDKVQELYAPCISVILDCCGFAGTLGRARKIWAWAGRWSLNRSNRVWAAWLECLCRNGEMQEAFDTVLRMRDGEYGKDIFVEKSFLELLLKFSWRDPEDWKWVQNRVREEFPEWWDQVKWVMTARRKGNNSGVTK